MKKRSVAFVLILSSLFLILSTVCIAEDNNETNSTFVNFTYQTDQSGFSADIYDCKDDCFSNTNPEYIGRYNSAENNLNLNLNSSNYLSIFYKECFQPLITSDSISMGDENSTIIYNFSKKSNCTAELTPLQLQKNYNVNEAIQIIGKVRSNHKIEEYSKLSQAISVTKTDRKDFFTGKIRVDFLVNNKLVKTNYFTLGIDESNTFDFSYTPQESGSYKIKITSKVEDCKCENAITSAQENTITVIGNQEIIEEAPAPEEINNEQNAEQTPQENTENPEEDATPIITGSLKFTRAEKITKQNAEQTTEECIKDNICNPKCVDGDPDCHCSKESGFLCANNQDCLEKILKSSDKGVCCSVPCSISQLMNNNKNIKPLSEIDNKKNTTASEENETVLESNKIQFPAIDFKKSTIWYTLLTILVIIVLLSILVSHLIHHFGEEAEFIGVNLKQLGYKIPNILTPIKESITKTYNQIKDKFQKTNIKTYKIQIPIKKEQLKPVKLNPLILKIMDTLGDPFEEDTMKIILNNEGIKKEDLQERLGYDRIKMEQILLRLERKQVIRKSGQAENPKIYLMPWLK